MDKKEMDDYFVKLLPLLEPIVKGVAYKLHKKLDTYVVINEAYIHMCKYEGTINNEKELQKLIINFINKNIIWTNSKINKMEKVNNIGEFINTEIGNEDDEIILENKIEIEKWWDEKQCMLACFYEKQTKEKQIIFDCYFKKNIIVGTHLAKHLKINIDYACKYLRELKADLVLFNEEWLKNG